MYGGDAIVPSRDEQADSSKRPKGTVTATTAMQAGHDQRGRNAANDGILDTGVRELILVAKSCRLARRKQV